jgi:hypothetical protein
MKIELLQKDELLLADVQSEDIVIASEQDALDLMANCRYQGSTKIMLREENIVPSFFDLKTKVAGEILQKFSTYRCQLAIIGDFEQIQSKSLRDFVLESNKIGLINFVNNKQEAIECLSRKSRYD